MPDFAVILPAAGSSSRFGSPLNKLLHPLRDRPVMAWTLSRFASRDDVREIVVACNDLAAVSACVELLEAGVRKKVRACAGGTCRSDSVRLGVLAASEEIEWIAVHDAARPLVSQGLIDRTFAGAIKYGAAAAALPAHLTIKQAMGPLPAKVQRTLPRQQLWAMQTPQAMRRRDLLEAYGACPIPLAEVTDDVQLLELAGKEVWLVDGEEKNLKITTTQDLQIALMLMES
ncbi:MAG: 2-C-methyl-D-erythritol 4-phosphate cytidylyltransferase [Tepidisphaeraceae bacterium]|jgi:2-C-methyl-D-erythritol 4-phosphate cytidylyltransferase